MRKIDTAVILAAGMGVRLQGVVNDRPKGLLEIENRAIIKESLDRIADGGIDNVIMVTGYASERYQKELADEYPHIRYLQNPEYAQSGSMHSLFLAREGIKGNFLLFESDLIYEERCIPALVESSQETELLISGKTGSGDEVYVYGDAEKKTVSRINKKKLEGVEPKGELIGISKLSYSFFRILCDYYDKNLATLKNSHYEECISDLSSTHDVFYLKIPDIVWTEIDDPNHYKRAVEFIYPRIRAKSAK